MSWLVSDRDKTSDSLHPVVSCLGQKAVFVFYFLHDYPGKTNSRNTFNSWLKSIMALGPDWDLKAFASSKATHNQ